MSSARPTLRPMDLITHMHRRGAAVVSGPVQLYRRVTWSARLAILASCLFVVGVAISSWIPLRGLVAIIAAFIWTAVALAWFVDTLSRWQHRRWAARLAAIGSIVFALELAVDTILIVFGQKSITLKSIPLVTAIIIIIFALACLAFLEHELAKVTASSAARVLVPLAVAFLYLFPPILVFLATSGNVNSFRLATGLLNETLTWAVALGFLLLASVPLLLVVVPEILRRKLVGINVSASTKDALPKELGTAAALATGLYAFTLHFSQGPLARISISQLLFAIIAVVLLLGPFYRSIANVCWERGIAIAFSPAFWLIRPVAIISELRKIFAAPVNNQEAGCNSADLSIPHQADGHHVQETENSSGG